MRDIPTARLLLEPLVAAHAEPMFSLLSDPSVHVYIDSSPPESVESLRQRYLRLEARASPDQSQLWLNWVVVLPGLGPIGFVQATVMGSTAWVAYLLGRKHRARGYATEATSAMLAYLVSVHGTSLFRATVEVDNSNSIALLRRIGFRLADSNELASLSLLPTERSYVKNAGGDSHEI